MYFTKPASSSGSASPTEAADEMCSFLVIKHSWKGKYKRLVIKDDGDDGDEFQAPREEKVMVEYNPPTHRVFCIGALSITTYNPSTMEATNQWQYSDFITILPAARGQVSLCLQLPFDLEHFFCLVNHDHFLVQASQPNNEFIITFKKGKKTDSMRFSSEQRACIITEAMK